MPLTRAGAVLLVILIVSIHPSYSLAGGNVDVISAGDEGHEFDGRKYSPEARLALTQAVGYGDIATTQLEIQLDYYDALETITVTTAGFLASVAIGAALAAIGTTANLTASQTQLLNITNQVRSFESGFKTSVRGAQTIDLLSDQIK